MEVSFLHLIERGITEVIQCVWLGRSTLFHDSVVNVLEIDLG